MMNRWRWERGVHYLELAVMMAVLLPIAIFSAGTIDYYLKAASLRELVAKYANDSRIKTLMATSGVQDYYVYNRGHFAEAEEGGSYKEELDRMSKGLTSQLKELGLCSENPCPDEHFSTTIYIGDANVDKQSGTYGSEDPGGDYFSSRCGDSGYSRHGGRLGSPQDLCLQIAALYLRFDGAFALPSTLYGSTTGQNYGVYRVANPGLPPGEFGFQRNFVRKTSLIGVSARVNIQGTLAAKARCTFDAVAGGGSSYHPFIARALHCWFDGGQPAAAAYNFIQSNSVSAPRKQF
jgi:hypothetical protein